MVAFMSKKASHLQSIQIRVSGGNIVILGYNTKLNLIFVLSSLAS